MDHPHDTKGMLNLGAEPLEASSAHEASRPIDFEKLFDYSCRPEAICSADRTITTANRRFLQLSGHRRGDIERKMRLDDFMSPHDREMGKPLFVLDAADQARGTEQFRFTFIKANNEQTEVELTVSPLPGGHSYLLTLRDITDERQMEEEIDVKTSKLQSANQELKAANERLQQVIRKIEEWNRIQKTFFNLSKEINFLMKEDDLLSLFGQTMRSLFPGRLFCIRIVDQRTYELTSAYAEGRLLEEERQVVRITKGAFAKMMLPQSLLESPHIELTEEYEPVFPGTHSGLGVPLVASNQLFGMLNLEYMDGAESLTADKLVLIMLANQMSVSIRNLKLIEETVYLKSYLEKLLENANALILVIDKNRKLVVFNRAVEELTGHTKEEVIGTDLMEWQPESERNRFLKVLINSLRGLPTTNFETQILRKAGGMIRVVFNTAAILDAEGQVEGVIAIGQDITQMRSLQRQVIQAEKLATLGQLSASVVHELNNPLSSITIYAEYLIRKTAQTGSLPQEDQLKLSRILEGAERIQTFTRSLMSYARPSSGKLIVLSLNSVVELASSFCEHFYRQSGVEVEMDLSPDIPPVYGLPDQLQQVMINLITNACHAMEPEGGELCLATRALDDQVEIEVTDNGHGIEAADLDHIFDPFFSRKEKSKGSGLGLTIVRDIVENHNGTIAIASVPGKGTTFSVRLPLAQSQPKA